MDASYDYARYVEPADGAFTGGLVLPHPPHRMSSTTGRLAAGQAGLSLPSALFPLGRDGEGDGGRVHLVVQGWALLAGGWRVTMNRY